MGLYAPLSILVENLLGFTYQGPENQNHQSSCNLCYEDQQDYYKKLWVAEIYVDILWQRTENK